MTIIIFWDEINCCRDYIPLASKIRKGYEEVFGKSIAYLRVSHRNGFDILGILIRTDICYDLDF